MPEYRVVWEIDIEADTPKEAAKKALKIQRDPESTATVFDTFERGDISQFSDIPITVDLGHV